MNHDIEITQLDLVAGGNVIRQGHHFTLDFIPRGENGDVVALTGKDVYAVFYDKNGIRYEGPAEYVSAETVIRVEITENIGHGTMWIEFTVTDPNDATYKRKFPARESDARISITPSTDDLSFVGVKSITVEQLRNEQKTAQQTFEAEVLPRVQTVESQQAQLAADYEAAAGALTEDSEVILARRGEPTLGAFNDKVTAQLADKVDESYLKTLNRNSINQALNYEFGAISSTTGLDTTVSNIRVRSKMIYVRKGTVIRNRNISKFRINFFRYDLLKTFVSQTDFLSVEEYVISDDGFVRMVIGDMGNAPISINEVEDNIYFIGISERLMGDKSFSYELGALSGSTGQNGTATNERIRTNMLLLDVGTKIENKDQVNYEFIAYLFDAGGNFLSATAYVPEYTLTEIRNVRLVIRRKNNADISGKLTEMKDIINVKKEALKVLRLPSDKTLQFQLGTLGGGMGTDSRSVINNRANIPLTRINAGDKILNANSAIYQFRVFNYDLGLNFVSETDYAAFNEYTFPKDGYMRIAVKRSNDANLTGSLGELAATFELKSSYNASQDLNFAPNRLWGKKILNLGDSIAFNAGYAPIISLKNGMTYDSYAVGGATIANVTGQSWIFDQVNQAKTAGANPDYILFNGGTNDAVEGRTTAGTISEGYDATLDLTTFAGGFENMVKTLRLNWLGAKIIYIRVHKMDSRGELQQTYGDLAIEICKKWSIPYVDLYNEGGLNTFIPQMKSAYTNGGDGTHPNAAAYQLFYAPPIEAKMRAS